MLGKKILKRLISPIVTECVDDYIQKSSSAKVSESKYLELLNRYNKLIARNTELDHLTRELAVKCGMTESLYDASYDVGKIAKQVL
jgi:hypothetical protein